MAASKGVGVESSVGSLWLQTNHSRLASRLLLDLEGWPGDPQRVSDSDDQLCP